MSKKTADSNAKAKADLRHGQRGALVQPKTHLAGAEPLYALEDPPLASPDLATPEGQTTHQ
jgi:hypothetical protein